MILVSSFTAAKVVVERTQKKHTRRADAGIHFLLGQSMIKYLAVPAAGHVKQAEITLVARHCTF
jgi:hypothetical protein